MIHYQPIEYQPPKAEFIMPVAADYFIWWLFRYKCVKCKQTATEINEIVPRGRTKGAILDWRNRVTLCRKCHTDFHNNGVTTTKIIEMQRVRINTLISFGREAYLDGKVG